MGLPIGAAKQACVRDGKDPSIMDLDPEKSLASQRSGGDKTTDNDTGPPLRDDPEYSKVSLSCFISEFVCLTNYPAVLENAKDGTSIRCC